MKYLLLFLSLASVKIIKAQQAFPVIRANSKSVTIKDGAFLDRNVWTLTPGARPDVYTADRTRKTKWVVFYTDLDSIRVKVKPGSRYDFVILLNGKDSCYTRIQSAITPEKIGQSMVKHHDTIPFTLTTYNAIGVKAIINEKDTLTMHFDVSSFDFRLTRDAVATKLNAANKKVTSIRIGGLKWDNPEVVTTSFTAHEMDGRFGWNLFEGQQVEINYDRNLLIVHSGKFPKVPRGYMKSKLNFIRSFVSISGVVGLNGKNSSGDFILDTGADQAMILDSAWAANQKLVEKLSLIKTLTFKDPRGAKYETKIVSVPTFTISGLSLRNVPGSILGGRNPSGFDINFLGNDLLKRFNTILDFKNDVIYLKANTHFSLPYRHSS